MTFRFQYLQEALVGNFITLDYIIKQFFFSARKPRQYEFAGSLPEYYEKRVKMI